MHAVITSLEQKGGTRLPVAARVWMRFLTRTLSRSPPRAHDFRDRGWWFFFFLSVAELSREQVNVFSKVLARATYFAFCARDRKTLSTEREHLRVRRNSDDEATQPPVPPKEI